MCIDMAKLVLGFLVGAGTAFSVLAVWEKEEQKKLKKYEEWRRRLP